jgi:hypothetical protein
MGLKKEVDKRSAKSEIEACESLMSLKLEENQLNIVWKMFKVTFLKLIGK